MCCAKVWALPLRSCQSEPWEIFAFFTFKVLLMNGLNVRRSLLFVFSLLLVTRAYNQKYNTAVGLRFGNDLAVSLEQRLFDNYTLQLEHQDAIFTNEKNSSLLLKKHFGILGKRFNVSLGGGVAYHQQSYVNELNNHLASPALMFSAGGEFTLGRLNIIYDFMPGYQVGQNPIGSRFYSYGGVGLRYVMWKRPKKSQKAFDNLAFWKKHNNKKSSKNKKNNKR